MAHSATITSLTGELVSSVTGLTSSNRAFRQVRDGAVRSFRLQQYGRVNQFEVRDSLGGLIEKFEVLEREDLADVLKPRLEELGKTGGKWTPEILSLFLLLSDRPVEKTPENVLDLLRSKEPDAGLTWDDIIRDDPLNEKGIWDDINYAIPDSDDDVSLQGVTEEQGSTRTTSPEDPQSPEAYTVPLRPDVLHEIEEAQFWKPALEASSNNGNVPGTSPISDLQAIREIIFMLNGLPTSLFRIGEQDGRITYNNRYVSRTLNPSTMSSIMDSVASLGSQLQAVRIWTTRRQSVPLLQTFHAAVMARLRRFVRKLAPIEQSLLAPTELVVVSLVNVYETVKDAARPLLCLSPLLLPAYNNPFEYLEKLFESVCIAQATGMDHDFSILANVFFECIQNYLKPLRAWMDNGTLISNDEVFFVTVADQSCESSSLWHDRYMLRRKQNGSLFAPNFLHAAGLRILNTGKSVVFLKELGQERSLNVKITAVEPRLDYDSVCSAFDHTMMPPFTELFDTAFDDWIASKHSNAVSSLKTQMLQRCGLWTNLDALEHLYFSREGTIFQTFTDNVFEKLDARKRFWTDRFVMTELAQETFVSTKSVDVARLSVRTVVVKVPERSIKALNRIVIDYCLPWPIANIIRKETVTTYRRIFTVISQVYRA
ncbi:hypothetical protein LTS18_005181, partial [Coniosporium uncinatum]